MNLKTLLDDDEFKQAAAAHRADVSYFTEGTGKYNNDQSEIVLNVGELVEADIWSFGGRSSNFDELVFRTFLLFYNREPATQQEFDAFRSGLSEMESQAGARWLEHESTQSVLRRVRPQAEVLRAIREEQERVRRQADEELKAASGNDTK